MRSGGTTRAPRCPSIHFCAEVPRISRTHPSHSICSKKNAHFDPHLFFFLAWSYSPNAEEALRLLSLPLPPTKPLIEQACQKFIDFGVGLGGAGWVIIRSGELGAFIACRSQPGRWIDPYWTIDERVVDVTGKFLHGHLFSVDPSAYLWCRACLRISRCWKQFFGWPCRRPRIERRRCIRGYVMVMSKLRANSRTTHTHDTTPWLD